MKKLLRRLLDILPSNNMGMKNLVRRYNGNVVCFQGLKKLSLQSSRKLLESFGNFTNLRVRTDEHNECVTIELGDKNIGYYIQLAHFFMKDSNGLYIYLNTHVSTISRVCALQSMGTKVIRLEDNSSVYNFISSFNLIMNIRGISYSFPMFIEYGTDLKEFPDVATVVFYLEE